MGLDVILNAAWVLTGVIALSVLCSRTHRKRFAVRIVGVCLLVAALFPIISASDDVIRISHWEILHARQHESSTTTSHQHNPDTLIRLYEAAEAGIIAVPIYLSFDTFFTLLFIAGFVLPGSRVIARRSARAPPFCVVYR